MIWAILSGVFCLATALFCVVNNHLTVREAERQTDLTRNLMLEALQHKKDTQGVYAALMKGLNDYGKEAGPAAGSADARQVAGETDPRNDFGALAR